MHQRARTHHAAVAVVAWLVLGSPVVSALAQSAVAAGDMQRLRDEVFEAGTDLSRLRTGDAALLKKLRRDLEDLRARITRLEQRRATGRDARVRDDYLAIRDEIQRVRRAARSESTVTGAGLGPAASAPDPASVPQVRLELPKRARLTARLLTGVNPVSSRPDDPVEAAVLDDLVAPGISGAAARVLVPAGSLLRGVVTITPATRKRPQSLAVRFESLTMDRRSHKIPARMMSPVGTGLIAGTIVQVELE